MQYPDVARVDDRRIDDDFLHLAMAVGDGFDNPAAGRRFDAFVLQFGLQARDVLLQLLDLLHHFADIAHARISIHGFDFHDLGAEQLYGCVDHRVFHRRMRGRRMRVFAMNRAFKPQAVVEDTLERALHHVSVLWLV